MYFIEFRGLFLEGIEGILFFCHDCSYDRKKLRVRRLCNANRSWVGEVLLACASSTALSIAAGGTRFNAKPKFSKGLESIEDPSILANKTTASATVARAPEAYNGASQETSPSTASPASRST